VPQEQTTSGISAAKAAAPLRMGLFRNNIIGCISCRYFTAAHSLYILLIFISFYNFIGLAALNRCPRQLGFTDSIARIKRDFSSMVCFNDTGNGISASR
jgi:hypothetical protein